jgi:hypothetical protein
MQDTAVLNGELYESDNQVFTALDLNMDHRFICVTYA